MALIRTKRASTTATNGPGQQKTKYRKRSVSRLFDDSRVFFLFLDLHWWWASSSAPHLLGSATRAIFERLRNGGVDPTERGLCAMPVVCVRAPSLCRCQETARN